MSKQANKSPYWGMSGAFTPGLAVMFGVLLALTIVQGAGATNLFLWNTTDINDTPIIDWNGADRDTNYGQTALELNYGAGVAFTAAGNNKIVTLIKGNFTSIPSGAIIHGANLTIYHQGMVGYCGVGFSLDVALRRVLTAWKEGNNDGASGDYATWNNPISASGTWDIGWFSSADYSNKNESVQTITCGNTGRYVFSISNYTITGMINGSLTNNGFVLVSTSSSSPANSIGFIFVQNNTEEYTPHFEIEYEYTPPIPPEPPERYNYTTAATFCATDSVLFLRGYDVADNGSAILNERYVACDFGCANSTITALGAPGCKESNFTLMLMLIIGVVLMVALIRWVAI